MDLFFISTFEKQTWDIIFGSWLSDFGLYRHCELHSYQQPT